jgi:hypothetical protein
VNVILGCDEMTLRQRPRRDPHLSWLKTNAPRAQPLIVANKVQPGVGEISKADFEASIERKINYTIPFDSSAAANAAKLGQTFRRRQPLGQGGAGHPRRRQGDRRRERGRRRELVPAARQVAARQVRPQVAAAEEEKGGGKQPYAAE